MSNRINIILSGGSGTRLWPLSRKNNPKQFIQMFNDKSLFQHTLERNAKIVDQFMIITNMSQFELASKQAEELGIEIQDKVLESVGRNTAPAIAMACLKAHPDSVLFVTPSDHMIEDMEVYEQAVNKAVELANQGFLVTFGIKPTHPETGFGYIEHENEEVLSFREKPDFKTALKFIEQKKFLWNSGMFCFKASTFIEELKKFRPDILAACEKAVLQQTDDNVIPLEIMKTIPEESVDYAVFEKSEKIKVIPSDFYWTDLGAFDALLSYQDKSSKNFSKDLLGVAVEGSKAISSKKVFGIGVKDILLVEQEDVIVLINKDSDIKDLYNLVKEEHKSFI